MKKTFSNASKIFTLACISTAMVIASGCQTHIDSKVNSAMGIQAAPPVITNTTTDPEMQSYITLLKALDSGLQGVRGKDMSAQEKEALVNKVGENARISLDSNAKANKGSGVVSAAERLRMIESARESERGMVRHPLSLLPIGADSQESMTFEKLTPTVGNELMVDKMIGITIDYKFGSVQERLEKMKALKEKFSTILTKTNGWQNHQMAGLDMFNYSWSTPYRQKVNNVSIIMNNNEFVTLIPNPEMVNGKYQLQVGISRTVLIRLSQTPTTGSILSICVKMG